MHVSRLCLAILFFVFTSGQREVAGDPLTFEQHVVPVLKTRCFKCHGGEKREAGLDLRRRFAMVRGGDSGPSLVPGKPDESLLVEMVADRHMPPEGEPALEDAEIALLRRWVAAGAPTVAKEEAPLPETDGLEDSFTKSAREHWAFQPVRPVNPPPVRNANWVRTPVDAFVLARLEERGWQPARPATRRELIRRVCFDLTGLPPAPEQVATFLRDNSPTAYEKLVDNLLESPGYGERWASHWLDVVRFAETEGFEYDRHVPGAWRFRDYVIEAFNSDKPFDRFVLEQLAGDEIAPDDPVCQSAAIFHRLGAVRRNAGNPDIALSRNEVLTDRANIVGEAFLGLTVGCARCHNHKLEPITQNDYYRLQAYFSATAEHNITLASAAEIKAWEEQTAQVNAQIKSLKEEAAKSEMDPAELERQVDELAQRLPPHLPTIPSIRNDFENRTPMHVLRRGIWEQKGVPVGPRPLSVLVSAGLSELPGDVSHPRTHLAEWIASGDHPLTARVLVNRVWQHHFGTGLVKTVNDFGTHGDHPSHPELLDWLAQSFVEKGWHLKPLHRMILLSNTYRQASNISQAEYQAADPENRLLWQFNRRRLAAEEIRDAMLTVSGRLNPKAGGPSVMVPVDPELVGLLYKPSQWQVARDPAEFDRRSIYLLAKRNLRLPFMEAFDAPTLQTSCPVRESSTHAPQALELLNGDFANEMAEAFAARLQRECQGDAKSMVLRGFRLAAGREPTTQELTLSLEFLKDQPVREFALAMFNLNGFLYVD